ncbi:MAG TPA: type I 3-dehydroquinate dehydratase [Deltaproteobacteria bacterium]|nr:MAG: type I 3-dehydroquinate dehydratase [Deltaproteobacteria bacterium GWA2_55_82]OGQ64828.1 MAG: type I 3-dehydroquinate dehydratase [Deltaproteobacteria bacterium RIFCSPLOWO2_02_FULL_55_12]OIJ73895.1 MAG: type I 3-dehydroquinate dehydratase [Deltaproteobacteria bacterium GWC2_55_46]HBG46284.1 type I 3-dehydroquinate dehydratase [Deltaproteobacteria bacterium]HCY09887.1 type I 3-dehydroquinate dehydratase [Deltaproteobacteria bacterium]
MSRIKKSRGPKAAAVIVGMISPSIVKRAISNGADLLEVRIDTFRDKKPEVLAASLKDLKKSCKLPIILTIRSRAEGGQAHLDDDTRISLFNTLIPFAEYVDIEISSSGILKNVVKSAKKDGKKVIASHHDFKSTPDDKKLNKIIDSGLSSGADIVKIATYVNTPDDLRRLVRLPSSRDNLIVIGMGAFGAASRVFFPMIGSLFSYGSITGKTAPGQLSLRDLKREFKRYGF